MFKLSSLLLRVFCFIVMHAKMVCEGKLVGGKTKSTSQLPDEGLEGKPQTCLKVRFV